MPKKQSGKGICQRQKKFYGVITITDKGQIAIPIELRRELGLEMGDKLLVIKRGDDQGVNLIKDSAIDSFLTKMSVN